MDRSSARHSTSPISPSSGPSTPVETKAGPSQVKPQSPATTPLTARLQAWERDSDRGVPSARRLNVESEAEVRGPRIGYLADGADLSDDEDADIRMPPARVAGVSPDTSYAVSDPAWDDLWTAMRFLGAAAGMSQEECADLMRNPHMQRGLLGAMARGQEAWGYPAGTPIPDRARAELATSIVSQVLDHLRSEAQAPGPQPSATGGTTAATPDDDGLPSLDDLQGRFDALAAQAATDSADTPTTPYLGPTPLARKPDGKG